MIIFTTRDYYKKFIPPLLNSGTTIGSCKIKRYPNDELYAVVDNAVEGEDCLIIGSIAPPDNQLLGLAMLASALKRGGAKTVRAFLPYLGYEREDKLKKGESGGISLVGSILKASGIDAIIAFDVHSELDKQLIGLPLISLPVVELFVPKIQKLALENATIVAPDKGASARAEAFASAANFRTPVAHFTKKRDNGIIHTGITGEIGKKAIIIDDILDSGQTLLSACRIMQNKGTEEITVIVTHGFFRTQRWQELFELGVVKILASDSCPEALEQEHPNVEIVSLESLLNPKIISARI